MALNACSQDAPDLPLYHDERGQVMLSEFWRERTTVFVFLRHFG
jgi:hypothetical protein